MTDPQGTKTFVALPKTAGYWLIPGSAPYGEVRYCMPRRPAWFHRVMMRALLGWVWRDGEGH